MCCYGENRMMVFLVTLLFLFLGSEGYVFGNGAVRNVQGNTADPYIFIGHNLSLWCNLSITDVDANSRLMYFTKGNYELIPMDYITIVNTKTIQLNYPIISVNDEGNYVCNLNGTTHRTVGNQFVTVEYETKPAKNVKCLVYNWENMTCRWELGVPYNHMKDIEVHLIWAIMEGQFDCPHMSKGKTSCSWKKFDGNDSFKSQQIYHMVVLVKNVRDPMKREKKTEVYKINTSRIVKPAPVENLRIKYQNTTCARISWQHSSFFEKYYEVTYSSQWDSKETSRTTDDSNILICNLTPYTMYTFRVRCKPAMEGYWSEGTEFLNRTPEDVPAGAPLMKPGSYTEYPCSTSGCREVLIYWKPMSLQKQNGEIVEYIMNITSINIDGVVEARYPRHILKDRNSVKLTLESSKNYRIRLSAATEVGISKNFSSLFISSHDYNLPSPKQFVVEAEENHVTTMHFSWREPVVTEESLSIIGYTLYWCEGSVLRLECDGDLHWISLPAHQTTYKMYDFARDYDNYMFGISVNVVTQSGKIVSRGLKWSSCTYKADAVPQFPPQNVQVTLVGQDIRVDWDPYDCLESRGHVISYLIRYCVVGEDDVCSGQKIIRADGDDVHHLLQDLKLEETYYITVSPFTSAGEGPQSLPMKIAIPFTGIRTETLAGIVVAVLVVIILAVVGLCYLCRKFLKWKKKCDVPKNLEGDFGALPDLPLGESFSGSTGSYYRSKYPGYSEIQSTTSTFLPGYSYGQNPKKGLYKGDKPREYTSSTRSLLHISDDNSEMSEQNKGQCDNSQGKPSGAGNNFSETDHDYEDIDEVVSKVEELEKNTKNKKKKAGTAPASRTDMKLRLNPLHSEDGTPHHEILKHKLKPHEDSYFSDIPTLEKLTHKNRTIGPYTKFGSAGSVAHPSYASSASSNVPAYSQFGSCGELVGGDSSHYMPQNVIGPTHVSAVPKDIRNITDNNNKSSDLIQSLHDQLTLQRPERRIPDLKLAPSGQYYTLEQVNEQSSSSSSSASPQSSSSSAELEKHSAQNRCRNPDNSESSSGTNSLSNSGESTQTEVYIPTSEVIRKLPKNFFEDRIHQNHMPLTHL